MNNKNILFDSFNARYLSFEEIADSFIPNKQFNDLKGNSHSLLMGPRGSGKTTLLKMLTPICQHYLQERNKEVFSKLPFWGVYIPTDIQWRRQIDYFESIVEIDHNIKALISRTTVTTNILISLLKTFSSIIDLKDFDENERAKNYLNLSKKIINSWHIEKPIAPDFYSIESSLRNRLVHINSVINKIKFGFTSNINYEIKDYFTHDFFDLVVSACSSFENIFKNHTSFDKEIFRWALCFDELEIAPSWLQSDLLHRLRSTEQTIIFKLTTTPIISTVNDVKDNDHIVTLAREKEDFKIIRTWICRDYDGAAWSEFCKTLVLQKFQKKGVNFTPETFFGDNSLDRNLTESFDEFDPNAKTYEKNSLLWYLFRDLALSDSSFNKFLSLKDINPINPVPKVDGQKDSIFRKIKPLAVFRYQLIKSGRKRSRKNTSLYYGVPFLYELCDGNPRALMGLLDTFLSDFDNNESLSINKQSSIIEATSKRYLELIKSHPDSNKRIGSNSYTNLGNIISMIGHYFYNTMIIDPFRMDPYSTFIVDDKVPPKVIELIEVGVHLGAIIYINPTEAISDKGIMGKKLRLAYLLHPTFKLPKREYNSVDLSKIINSGVKTLNQTLLFDI